jgi:hypothetical protein
MPAGCAYSGTMHPNKNGYQVYANAIAGAVSPLLSAPVPPSGLAWSLLAPTAISIQWQDTVPDEDVFSITWTSTGDPTVHYECERWGATAHAIGTAPGAGGCGTGAPAALTPGLTYTISVRSCNELLAPSSVCSTAATLTVQLIPPAAPTNAHVSTPIGRLALELLLWTDNSTNEDRFEVSALYGTSWTAYGKVPANTTSTAADSTGAVNSGDAYRVRACLSQLCSDWSNIAYP